MYYVHRTVHVLRRWYMCYGDKTCTMAIVLVLWLSCGYYGHSVCIIVIVHVIKVHVMWLSNMYDGHSTCALIAIVGMVWL